MLCYSDSVVVSTRRDIYILAELVEDSKAIGEDSLKFLAVLKMDKPGSGKIASGANDLHKSIRALQRNTTVSW